MPAPSSPALLPAFIAVCLAELGVFQTTSVFHTHAHSGILIVSLLALCTHHRFLRSPTTQLAAAILPRQTVRASTTFLRYEDDGSLERKGEGDALH